MAGTGVASGRALETAVVGHRRGGGTRTSLLRSVRTQLLAPIVVAMAGLAVLGTVQTVTAADAARDADRAQVLAITATRTVLLTHELEREMAETVALRQRGGSAGTQLMIAQRRRTDGASTQYQQQVADARKGASGELNDRLNDAANALAELQTARDEALQGTPQGIKADPIYRRITNALLAVADALPAQVRDPDLANAARTVAAVAALEHFDALSRDLVRGVFARGRLEPGELVELHRLLGAREQRRAEFSRVATAAALETFANLVQGTDVDNAERMSAGVRSGDRDTAGLKGDPDAWYTAQSGLIRRINLVGLQLTDRLDELAADIARDASRRALLTALGTAGIAGAALVTAILLAVRTSRRLRRLRAAALTVARRELPDAIAAVTAANARMPVAGTSAANAPTASATTRAIAATNDEIGQVADAFGTVHRTALRLAAEQAELRNDVARMAEVLARRIRTLITRQLRLLDEFERDETDPDVLARLFALDHIAARLRRNGENLLVLAGGEPGRPATGAFPLRAVVTAAASEIEDFARVEAQIGTDLAVAAPAVGDIVHLLAELLENAASFSPPESQVHVDARRSVDGAILRVHDNGIGIAPNRIAEINSRLARPTTLTSAAAGTMGLYVVAHLAARHGVRVQLHGTGTGTVAYVLLPMAVLADPPAIPAPRAVEPTMPALAGARIGPRSVAGAPGGQYRSGPAPAPTVTAAADAWFAPNAARVEQHQQPPVPQATGAFGGAFGSGFGNGFGGPPQTGEIPVTNEGELPRRRPGNQLAPETQVAPPPIPAPHGDEAASMQPRAVDPEMVRARLSAFAEGVSAAALHRGANGAGPTASAAGKDRR